MVVENESLKKLLELLNKHHVKYLIIGGVAVNFHGYNRTTGDVDIWLEPTNENKAVLVKALSPYYEEEDIEELESRDFTKPVVFKIGEQPFRVDLLTVISGARFEDAFKKRVYFEYQKNKIPFISLEDLIVVKMVTGRTQDKADVEALVKVMRYKKNA